MAGAICGPPMTLMPTALNGSRSIALMVSLMKSRSTLPSMIRLVPLRSSAADRCSKDNGNLALERDVIVGLISNVLGDWVMGTGRW